MTATTDRSMKSLLTDALAALNLKATKVEPWVEADNPPTRPGPILHYEVRLRSDPRRVYAGCRDLGWESEEELARWIASRVLEMSRVPGYYSHMDMGQDAADGYRQVRAGYHIGVGPRLTRAQMKQTGRAE